MIRSAMKPKAPRKKRCPFCREMYQPDPGLQANCCHKLECRAAFIAEYTRKARAKRAAEAKKREAAERADFRERKEKAKTAKKLRPEAWKAFSAYVRYRDEGKSCISCTTILVKRGAVGGDYDAGHYRAKGSAKHLEFDERNVHGQCKHCNRDLAGNPIAYEKGLIERIGKEEVEALKADQDGRRLRADDYRAIKAHYTKKIKELKNGSATSDQKIQV